MDWKKNIYESKTAGLTQKEFCKQNGISLSTLQYHLGKQRKEKESPGFLRVQIPEEREIFRIRLLSDGKLDIEIRFDWSDRWRVW